MAHRVLVFGATGKTGQAICQELLLQGVAFSVFARKESTAHLKDLNVRVYAGDVLDKRTVIQAIKSEKFTDIIVALGTRNLKDKHLRYQGTQHILEAIQAKQENIQVHAISALGIGSSWQQLPWVLKNISKVFLKSTMEDHRLQEESIMDSTIPFHIIRPAGLKNGKSANRIHVQNHGRLPNNSVHREVLAQYMVYSVLTQNTGFSSVCDISLN